MARQPIGELVQKKSQPQTTLSLLPSFNQSGVETVESYIFTDTIRSHFETILDTVARGVGQGIWVQAEYGAGKTHFLATLACLLADPGGSLWDSVADREIARYRQRFQNTRLFPVLVSLRGEGSAGGFDSQSLLDVLLEKGFRPALERAKMADVLLTSAEDMVHWLEKLAPAPIRQEIEAYVQREAGVPWGSYVREEGTEAAARHISDYCDKHAIRPQIAAGIKERLAYIYRQITGARDQQYTGLLFIIDEFEGWARNRTTPEATSHDAELLETLAYLLPKDLGMVVHTIVASQSDVPAKLLGAQQGDRFIRIPLLADKSEHDYDLIISRRVRGLREDRLPEINDHYVFHRDTFEFARNLSQGAFMDLFPFQPRCFEVVRRLTARDLPTARSGILIFYEVVNHTELLANDQLIRVCDLLKSDHLSKSCLTTTVYRPAYNAYLSAREALPSLGLEGDDLSLAEDVLATLFLWHLAYMERPRPMSLQDLAQATLTQDALLKAEDSVMYVLNEMRSLAQVAFDGKEARFEPTNADGPQPIEIFRKYVGKVSGDRYRLRKEWSDSLFLSVRDTGGQAGLLYGLDPDKPGAQRITYANLEYPGEVAVGLRWRLDWQMPLPKNDTHFRLVMLTPEAADAPKASDLQDRRIAVVYPGELGEAELQAAAENLAWVEMNKDYQGETGKDAELVRDWLAGQRPVYLNGLLRTHLPIYRSGRVITQSELGIDAREVFNQTSNDRRWAFMVEKLLSAAYDHLPLDPAALRSTLTPAEVSKVYQSFLSSSPSATVANAARSYGVGLRLSVADAPNRLAPQPHCKAFEIIREMLAEKEGSELPVWRIYERLSTIPYGLPYPVIQLYLLMFVRHGDPRVDLMLKRDHKLTGPGKNSFSRDRVTAGTVAELDWRPGIENSLDVLVPVSGPSWNDALTYAKELVPDLRQSTQQADIEAQVQRLESALASLGDEVKGTRDTISTLERSLADRLPEADNKHLQRLQELAETDHEGYAAFYESACELWPTPDALRDAQRTHSRLRELARQAAQINEMKGYLEAAEFRTSDGELDMAAKALLARLSLTELAAQPSLWNSLQAQFQQYRERYHNEYLKHHRDTNKALAELADKLERAPRLLHALALLNRLEELGPPRGQNLQGEYERLKKRVNPCPVTDYRHVKTDAAPYCAQCGLKLTQSAPQSEVQAFERNLQGALDDRTRALASEAIRRVLERSQQDAVARFVQVVQTANMAALVDVLDDQLIALIRQLLAEEQVATVEAQVLRRFADIYPSLEEHDLPEAIKRFEQMLREAFAEARKSNADKKTVRLSLR